MRFLQLHLTHDLFLSEEVNNDWGMVEWPPLSVNVCMAKHCPCGLTNDLSAKASSLGLLRRIMAAKWDCHRKIHCAQSHYDED